MEWTDEAIARLRDLWSQGLSTAEIGRQLSITKNAVVGKAHRLGLPSRPSPIRSRKAKEGETVEPTPRRKPAPRKTAKEVKAAADQTSVVSKKPSSGAEKPKEALAAASVEEKKKEVEATSHIVKKVVEAAPQTVKAKVVEKAVEAPAKVVPLTPPKPAQTSRPLPPPRFLGSIDRSTRRGPACCWPIGDPGTPGFHFCGATPLSGKPYCAEHAAIAYVKIRDRRD
ncbi:GcrA family cell cycle regulator [Swingsia samuiensis]|uniref:GcrA cell cycle regulator n=1 Tax=Swingsia samuiensis TaxID=1293412 RepID=A0A4Y6UGH5_9PROT|nr:GcrA family cell cycle regulator [Swingsia samuiensis]QDH16659.1 GcrA cell cycle regulator [Swingsia samuiensis]